MRHEIKINLIAEDDKKQFGGPLIGDLSNHGESAAFAVIIMYNQIDLSNCISFLRTILY